MLVLIIDMYSAVEYNENDKPIAGFYDFNDEYDQYAFESAKNEWLNSLRRGRKYAIDQTTSSEFFRGRIYEAETTEDTTIKIIKPWIILKA